LDQHTSEDLIFEHEQNTREDGDSGDGDEGRTDSQGREANLDSQTAGPDDLSEEELADIGDNYDSITYKMEQMVRDALGYAGYDSEELEKLRKLVADMRTPLYLGRKGKWTKLFASLKLL
jgi:hypothetical protein